MQDFIALVEPLIPALRRYARALTRDTAAADDLVQDTLERALARWGQRRADGDARTWLFAILHNKAVGAWRQRQRRGVHLPWEDAGERSADAALHAPTPQEEALHQRDVLAALDQLPEEQRAVLLLVAVEGLSYAEVARVLSIPQGTVMSRLARGRERLRRGLATDGGAQEADSRLPTVPLRSRPFLRRVK